MRVLAVSVVMALAITAPASAALVYQQPATDAIVAAADDGSNPRVIAHGALPAVSPDGRRVAFVARPHSSKPALRLVGISGGSSTLLLRGVIPVDPAAVWSPDSHHLVATPAKGSGAWLIDAVKHRRRFIPLRDESGGATFSPNGLTVLVDDAYLDHDLYLAETRLGSKTVRRRSITYGLPVWGRQGLAFLHSDADRYHAGYFREVIFRRKLGGPGRTILRTGPIDIRLVAWSGDGGSLLLDEDDPATPTVHRAVLLSLSTGETRTLAPAFSAVEGLSKDGQHVLAEMDGNVVTVDLAGNVTVLARGATTPSWTAGAYL